MAGYDRTTQETLALTVAAARSLPWVRKPGESLGLLCTAKVPGGTSGYRYDIMPFDRKVKFERLARRARLWAHGEAAVTQLKRRIRIESLGLPPQGLRRWRGAGGD